ncbi:MULTISPECIES: hypothetical protein [Piscirickettsiaceae]|jgi:flagellar basal body-associated protein FliL|uniref:Uncharacterized protein n=1 Tax=Hydrogenovibrio thermophilus TaxID=265883 RepID=A0A410H3E2_9GAMM|nr:MULTISPECIES: hypothetical protein [Piscirickettsiaceae]AZR82017.1 hypothetical protein AYJ59_06790 [Thiomicrospira sp. S5]QAB15448.1 hypothetical protein EPV75_07115 [Hydrogenovibrio thermophilus]
MLSILLQILALVIFIALIWPYAKQENWKEKFIDNKQARSILIVFVLILLFTFGLSLLFENFYPIERLDR